MPSRFGLRARYHNLVPFAGTDLVVTTRAPVGLHGLVGLHVAHLDTVRVVRPTSSGPGVFGPAVLGHRGSGSAGEEAPRDE